MPYLLKACPKCSGDLALDRTDSTWSCLACSWQKPPDDPLPLVPNARFSGQRGKDARGTEE